MSTKKSIQKQDVMEVVQEDDSITIPVIEIFHQLKKYLLLWLIIAIVGAGLVFGGSLGLSSSHATPLTALVGFSFDGIENGLDPNGNEFDVNSIKSPTVIEDTMTDLGIDQGKLETIRGGLTISGVVPDNAIDELTAYQSIFEATNSIEAANKVMDVSYFPTQYKVEFAYAASDMTRSEGAEFLNTLLDNYKTYFMRVYGYNDAFGDALTSVDYTQYDYPQAIDVFTTTLNSLQGYISHLSEEDTTRFRSTETGYSFSDLNEAIATMKTVDLATVSSYVYGKNVTKDKDVLVTYYEYRIDTLTRSMNSAKEQLVSITESIENYQKDAVVIMAGENSNTPLTQASEAYDELIQQKVDKQASVSTYQQQIQDYTERLETLQKKSVGSTKDKEKVDADMAALGEKINTLVESSQITADEFFETASYEQSYNVLLPASGSVSNVISIAISNMVRPLMVIEALIFVCYLVFAVVRAFIVSYRRESLMIEADAEKEKEE